MAKNKRIKNEREFDNWQELPTGGRKYWFDVKGRQSVYARYIKITDENENTITFVQEIYDNKGTLVWIHEKYPVDKGHKKPKP